MAGNSLLKMVKKTGKKKDDDWTGTTIETMNKDEDGQDLGGLMSLIKPKKGKKKQIVVNDDDNLEPANEREVEVKSDIKIKKEPKPKQDAILDLNDPPEEPEIKLKSKKEKERERKERAKLALKQKKGKKEVEMKQDSSVEDLPTLDEKPKVEPKLKGKAGKIAQLREALEEKKRLEDEQRKLEEEDLRKERELELEKERLEKQKEQDRLKKKEKEKLKKAELKKQGKFLTPAQKAAKQQQQAKLEAMLSAGHIVVPGVADIKDGVVEKEEVVKKKKVVYDNKKKKQPIKVVEERKVEEAKVVLENSDDDDWEKDVKPIVVEQEDWELSDVDVILVIRLQLLQLIVKN